MAAKDFGAKTHNTCRPTHSVSFKKAEFGGGKKEQISLTKAYKLTSLSLW